MYLCIAPATIIDNTFKNNNRGLYIGYLNGAIVESNTIVDSYDIGLCLDRMSGGIVAYNLIKGTTNGNKGAGVYCMGSGTPIIACNIIADNNGSDWGAGIYLDDGTSAVQASM